MVRTRILHNAPAISKILFASCLLLAKPAFGGAASESESLVGQVTGNRSVFTIANDNLLLATKLSATLELTFQSNQEFSAEQVALVLNGLQCTANPMKIRSHSDWQLGGGVRKLVIEMDSLRFGNQELFLDKVREVVQHRGTLTLDVRAPFGLKTAKFAFEYDLPPPPMPTVSVTATPSGSVVYTGNLTFQFTSPEGARHFECRHRGEHKGWGACDSPKTYSGLKNGYHHFRFRAIDRFGRTGPSTHYRVNVQSPPAPILITSVVPAENPTTSTSIEIAFLKNGPGGYFVQCRLDEQAWSRCRSPIRYTNLADGEHKVSLRRTNWIYSTILGRWLGRYAWFQAICPVFTDPVVYSWTIQRGAPSAEFVGTPKALTRESLARFEFRSSSQATFSCRLDGGAQANCTSPVEITVNEGLHTFEVTPLNGAIAGNAISFRWEVDQTAPELTLGTVIPSEALTSSSTLSLGFSASEPSTYLCALDGALPTACASPVQISGLADGAHDLAVAAVDAAGNQSQALGYEWTVDRTAPGATAQMTFPVSLPTKETRATFEFTASEAASFRCSVDGDDRGGCASPFTVNGLEEGLHEFAVVPMDSAGNVGVAATIQWDIDRTAPQIHVTVVDPSDASTESHTMRIDFEVSEAASVLCELDGGGQVPCHSPFLASNIADGNHGVEILAVDAAQNVSSTYRREWRVDSVAIVAISSVSPSAPVVGSGSLTIEFGSANSASFVCSLDGATFAACSSPVALSGLEDGAHRWEVRGLNLAGVAGPSAEHVWTIDTSGPVVALDSVNPAANPTASKELTVAFSSADAVSFFCSVDGAMETLCVSPHALAALQDGAHQISISGVDGLGNRGNALTYAWTVDTTGPVVAFGAISPAGQTVSMLSISAELTASEPVTFLCTLDAGLETACTSPFLADVGEGSHALSLSGVDALGNRGAAVVHSWAVEIPDAVAQIDSFSPSESPTSSRSASASFSATDATSFVCSLDGAAFTACASGVAFGNLEDGNHSFAVAALNLVNRRGPVTSRSWIVDTTGPVVQILSTNPSVSPTSSLSRRRTSRPARNRLSVALWMARLKSPARLPTPFQ